MSATFHYAEAEKILDSINDLRGKVREAQERGLDEIVEAVERAIPIYLAEAQVHATLALAPARPSGIG